MDTLIEITEANDAYARYKKKVEDLKVAQFNMRMLVRKMKQGDPRLGPSIVELQLGDQIRVRAEAHMVALYRHRWKLALRYLWEVKHFILAEGLVYVSIIKLVTWML